MMLIMGLLHIILPDDLEKKFRKLVIDKYGKTKGQLSKAVEEAIRLWIEKTERELASVK